MLYLYLDESGDLGFDFVTKNPSKYFTICVMVINGNEDNRKMAGCIKKTIFRKIARLESIELKGSTSSFAIKMYFYNLCKSIDFKLYSVTLNKRRVYEPLTTVKERVYNFVARQVIDRIPMNAKVNGISLVVDKSKAKPEIAEFNKYIQQAIKGRIDPKIPLFIEHSLSHENRGLQAVDLFCWGIFRKYEKHDIEWYKNYAGKIKADNLYLSRK